MTRHQPVSTFSSPALQTEQETLPLHESKTQRVDADLLIPGRGDPINNGTLVWEGNEIMYAGAQTAMPAEYAHIKRTKVPVLMPGLWDCHAHYMGFSTFDLVSTALESPALMGARAAKDLAATLNAGFTSIREPGGYAIDIAKAIEEGWLPGPHVYGCGAILSQTAGHGDMHGLPLSTVQRNGQEWTVAHVCDGVDECTKAVRQQIRRGAQCIKLCATGGVLSVIDSPRAPQFSPAELKAMVDEATRVGVAVAAHAHGKEGIMAALEAGVHTIEHGSYLDEEAIALMKKKGAMLVATRSISVYGAANIHLMPPAQGRKFLEVNEQHKKAYALAVKSGVRIALGTDLGVSSPSIHFNHGMNGQEFYLATVAGMTPLEAIEAGTANAPEVLGPRAPKSGQLREGYDADFIAVVRSPLEDIKVLSEAANVSHVWRAGVLCKAP